MRPKLYSSRLRWIRRDFPDRGGDGATKIVFLATEVDLVQRFRPRRRRLNFPDQYGDGATFQTEVETVRPKLYSSRLRWIRRDFPDRGGDDATNILFLATEVDTVQLSRPMRGRATFQTNAEAARLFRPTRRRRKFDNPGWAIDQSVFLNQFLEELSKALF